MTKTKQQSQQPIQRRYEPVWKQLSETPVGQFVKVRVHESAAVTFRQAISKEKSRETAEKKKLGMRFAGKMVITSEAEEGNPGYLIFTLSLEWDGRRL